MNDDDDEKERADDKVYMESLNDLDDITKVKQNHRFGSLCGPPSVHSVVSFTFPESVVVGDGHDDHHDAV